MPSIHSTSKKPSPTAHRVERGHKDSPSATVNKQHLAMPTVIRRLRVLLDHGKKIEAVKQARSETGYSLLQALHLVQHCEGRHGLSDEGLALSWCGSCRNSLSACQCAAPTAWEDGPSFSGIKKPPAARISGGAVDDANNHRLTQLDVWRKIHDLAGENPGEVKRMANIEVQKLETQLLDLWEILVPVASNEGVRFPEDHHEAFRRIVRCLPGNNGTTTRPAGDGDWQDNDTGKLYEEKMIPIRFRACRADAERIAEYACKFYGQIVVMAYKIASERDIIMATKK